MIREKLKIDICPFPLNVMFLILILKIIFYIILPGLIISSPSLKCTDELDVRLLFNEVTMFDEGSSIPRDCIRLL